MRHALAGRRPGETYHTPHGIIKTDEADGGATLTDDQRAYFEADGHELVELPDLAESTVGDDGVTKDLHSLRNDSDARDAADATHRAQIEVAANEQAAAEAALAAERVPSKESIVQGNRRNRGR